jgi:hypothetical protein
MVTYVEALRALEILRTFIWESADRAIMMADPIVGNGNKPTTRRRKGGQEKMRCRGLPSLFGGCGLRTQPLLQMDLSEVQRIRIIFGKNKK